MRRRDHPRLRIQINPTVLHSLDPICSTLGATNAHRPAPLQQLICRHEVFAVPALAADAPLDAVLLRLDWSEYAEASVALAVIEEVEIHATFTFPCSQSQSW